MASDCQVDFYVLGNPGQSAQHLACRLAMMAWEQGLRITVLTEDANRARTLDELMWEYPAGRFLPHSLEPGDPATPIRIGSVDSAIAADTEVVINLTATAVPEPERFKRLLEIVPGNEVERMASRDKFRTYRNQGLEPASHTIGN